MNGQVYEDAPVAPAGVDPTAILTSLFVSLTDEQLDAVISDLEALRVTRHGTAERTRVEHEPGADPRPGDG